MFGNIISVNIRIRTKTLHKTEKFSKETIQKNQVALSVVDPASSASNKQQKETKVIVQNSPNASKVAFVYISVHEEYGNVVYWKKKFQEIFKDEEISLTWCENNFLESFLVKFTSLKKAHKAKNILIKKQNEINFPKFVKLVKEDDLNSSLIDGLECSPSTLIRKKIDEQISHVATKRDESLREFKSCLDSLKSQGKDLKDTNVISYRLNDLNEQKINFLQFSENTCKKLNDLSVNDEDIDKKMNQIMKDYCHECHCFLSFLPIYGKKNSILKKVKNHQVVLLEAETGSGKTSQLCQYLLQDGFANNGIIICTQPRKIAAISVAKYVSSQIGTPLGSVVGYQVGMTKKMSKDTKILYVTDHTMLKICFENPLFQKVSCIVIDEAHERTVYTDILIGMIKKALSQRQDLRVVVTSATLKINVFQKYFDLPDSAVMSIAGRTFPIEDIWLENSVSLGWDYFEKTIEVTYNILQEDPGDVLVFLPTPQETEKAVQTFKKLISKSSYEFALLIYSLHGQLDVEEQQKIFIKTPEGSRKIVFATNCAETSITIPGIKYIVDSGMVKEAHYDTVRNMSVLSIGFVNRSSAEQRRGRAGRTQSGKCYRLYSLRNYADDMAESTLPEILRMNLSQAILKLMLLRVNPNNFDFVEAPPKEALSFALGQLSHLGAINHTNNKLTEMGFQMAILPLEPRLCYLILQGIEEKVGFESIIVAAVATVSRNVFFRNSQNKDEADLKKIRFCQSQSDFLTLFEVYKEWLAVPKKGKPQWCVLNCINNRSMKLTHELVNEILLTFSTELNLTIFTKLSPNEHCIETLHRVIFFSFSQNLCIYMGHKKFGYMSCIDEERELYIHPSSALNAFGDFPNFIVYDSILRTSRAFLMNVTSTNDAMLEEAIKKGLIKADLERLRKIIATPLTIEGLGCEVLKRVIGVSGKTLKVLEDQIQQLCGSAYCAIEADFEKGTLTIVAPSDFHELIENTLFQFIEGFRNELHGRKTLISNVAGITHLSAVISVGAAFVDIILPGEFRDVIVKPANCNTETVVKTLQHFGEIIAVKEGKLYKNITFSTITSATNAVESLTDYKKFSVEPGKSYAPSDHVASFKIFIHLVRRQCQGRAFFAIKPPHYLEQVKSSFIGSSIYFMSNYLRISMSKKCPEDFFVQNLPKNVSEPELRRAITNRLPPGCTLAKLIIEYQKAYSSSETEISEMENEIKGLFSQYCDEDKFHIHMNSPKSTDREWKALIFFDNPHDGQNVCNILNSRITFLNIPHMIFKMEAIVETKLTCSRAIFNAVEKEIKEALQFFKNTSVYTNKLNISAVEKNNKVIIKFDGNNIADIADAKKSVQKFIQGDPIHCSGKPLLEKLFTKPSRNYLEKLVPESYINWNHQSKVITIFGTESKIALVKIKINDYLDGLREARGSFKDISLRSPHSERSFLKQVISQYGFNLESLCTKHHLISAEIDIHRHVLTVHGDQIHLNQCEQMIKDMFVETDEVGLASMAIGQCPVCLSDVIKPFYRLEYCGHVYCETCILFQLQNVQHIPVLCSVEDCNEPFVLADILWASKKGSNLNTHLYRISLDSYVRLNSTVVKYCPTPDCSMIYRVSSAGKNPKRTCSSCQNDICTRCCVLFHTGFSCDLYNTLKDGDVDKSLKIWLLKDAENHKFCPSCKSPIEKNGGCTHMTCWKCGTHMCWKCMQVFPCGEDVYLHQYKCLMSC